jgi:3-oxoacyl-[acyl-carrier-protein] synthase III
LIRAVIAGVGGYLPERVLDNDALAATYGLDTSDAWIIERTGIRTRHLAAPGETASAMATIAARRALERAGVAASAVDCVIVATATPDSAFPATAVRVQAALGCGPGFAFDLAAACAGFVFALAQADALIRTGAARCALVIGAEVYSRILDWTDRGTCVLFGDGAGAVVLTATTGAGTTADRGILGTRLRSDGGFAEIMHVDGGAGSTGGTGTLRMAGREVFRHAVGKLADIVEETLAEQGLTKADLAWLVPHQANRRIIDAVGRKLGLPPERVVVTVDRHANTSAASVPLALADADAAGRLERGDLVAMEAIGGGLAWGAAIARW